MQLTWTGFVDWLWRAAATLLIAVPAAALVAKMWLQHRFDRQLKDREADRKREMDDLQRQHVEDLEQIRADLKSRQDLITAAIAAGAATQLAAQQRRIEAVETYWGAFLDLKELTYWNITGFQINVRLAQSIEERAQRANAGVQLREGGGWPAVSTRIEEIRRATDRLRPLLGEQLYRLKWVHETVLGSAVSAARPDVHKLTGNPLLPGPCALGWHETRSEDLRTYLDWVKVVVPEFDPERALALGDQLLRYVLDVLESAIAREMQFLLSGATASHERIEQARRVAEILPAPGTSLPGL